MTTLIFRNNILFEICNRKINTYVFTQILYLDMLNTLICSISWSVQYLDMFNILICVISWYVQYLDMCDILICSISWCVEYLDLFNILIFSISWYRSDLNLSKCVFLSGRYLSDLLAEVILEVNLSPSLTASEGSFIF